MRKESEVHVTRECKDSSHSHLNTGVVEKYKVVWSNQYGDSFAIDCIVEVRVWSPDLLSPGVVEAKGRPVKFLRESQSRILPFLVVMSVYFECLLHKLQG